MSNFKLNPGFKRWCEKAATAFRSEFGLLATAALPSEKMAEYLNVQVVEFSELRIPAESKTYLLTQGSKEWSAATVSSSKKTVILINESHTEERKNNSLMHELSHIILKHEPSKFTNLLEAGISFRTYDEKLEKEADWLAATLLLPKDVLETIGAIVSKADIERKHTVSPELLRFRLNLTGIGKKIKNQ